MHPCFVKTKEYYPSFLSPPVTEVKKPVVLVTGVFDLFHKEHATFLMRAATYGKTLLVGIETDERVKIIKGEGRPVEPLSVRAQRIHDLPYVTAAFVLPDTMGDKRTQMQLLEYIKPNILAVSSHTNHLEEKQKSMHTIGGELLIVHQHNPEVSTTKILEFKG
jgi:cytidyltransferase-like protein